MESYKGQGQRESGHGCHPAGHVSVAMLFIYSLHFHWLVFASLPPVPFDKCQFLDWLLRMWNGRGRERDKDRSRKADIPRPCCSRRRSRNDGRSGDCGGQEAVLTILRAGKGQWDLSAEKSLRLHPPSCQSPHSSLSLCCRDPVLHGYNPELPTAQGGDQHPHSLWPPRISWSFLQGALCSGPSPASPT